MCSRYRRAAATARARREPRVRRPGGRAGGADGRPRGGWHDATVIAHASPRRTTRLVRTAGTAVALTALATACTHSAAKAPAPQDTGTATPGQVHVVAPDVDLTITHAVAHLDASGSGTVTMTVRNGTGLPEHLDMVATPDGGRGRLTGAATGDNGSMTSAGILLQPGSTVTFAAPGPTIRLTATHGVTAAHTLPLMLQFGIARLVRLTAVVTGG